MKQITELNRQADNLQAAIDYDLDVLMAAKNSWSSWLENHKSVYLSLPVGGLLIGYGLRKTAVRKIILRILKLYHHSKLIFAQMTTLL